VGASALAAVLALGACGSTTEAAAPAAAKTSAPVAGGTHTVGTNLKAAIDYWTPSKMAAAKVRQLPKGESAGAPKLSAEATSGPELKGEGTQPTVAVKGGTTLDTEAGGPRQGDHAWIWKKHGVLPARAIGKLYFTGPDHNDYTCSASVIHSNNRSLLWTAAHCVYLGGWSENIVFKPDYHDGQSVGVWPVWSENFAPGWRQGNGYNSNYDIGAMVVYKWSNGQPIENYTGSLGYWFNNGKRSLSILDLGYPGDLLPSRQPVSSEVTRYCTGTSFALNLGGYGPTDLGLHCTLGHGASGGPWLTTYNHSSHIYVVGVNSTHSLRNDSMSAAYEGSSGIALYKQMGG
jgi:hypothetical protein